MLTLEVKWNAPALLYFNWSRGGICRMLLLLRLCHTAREINNLWIFGNLLCSVKRKQRCKDSRCRRRSFTCRVGGPTLYTTWRKTHTSSKALLLQLQRQGNQQRARRKLISLGFGSCRCRKMPNRARLAKVISQTTLTEAAEKRLWHFWRKSTRSIGIRLNSQIESN